MEILHLTENMRLSNPELNDVGRQEIAEFGQALLAVGDGAYNLTSTVDPRKEVVYWDQGRLSDNSRDGLITSIYGTIGTCDTTKEYLQQRAILAIANKDVNSINRSVCDLLPGNYISCLSVDSIANKEHEDVFQPEFFNAIDEASLAPYHLRLKVGMPMMMLRNLDPPRICNGTRLRINRVSPNRKVIEAEIMGGKHTGEIYLIHRIPMASKEDDPMLPAPFIRLQFPIRPAFAMTINKSQGQSLRHVGLDLNVRDCFSHGQLYVALTRVTSKANLRLIVQDTAEAL